MDRQFSGCNNSGKHWIWILVLIIAVVTILWGATVIYKRIRRRKQSLAGKLVLVTGAGGGLGRALCLNFAREKCDIICVDVNAINNENTVKQIQQISSSVKVQAFTIDITVREQVSELNQTILYEFPSGLDILVNNAGISHIGLITEQNPENIERVLNVNLISHFWTIKTFLPKMLEKNSGTIVAIASIASFIPMEGIISYSASKFGVLGMMETLSLELRVRKSNIKTLTVCPSSMATNMLPESLSKSGFTWINNFPLQILNVKKVSEGVINAIKDGDRIYVTPKHIQFAIFMRNFWTPKLIRDWIDEKILVVTKYLKKTNELEQIQSM